MTPPPIILPGITPAAVDDVIRRALKLATEDLRRAVDDGRYEERLESAHRVFATALTEGITFGSSEMLAQLIEAGVDVRLVASVDDGPA